LYSTTVIQNKKSHSTADVWSKSYSAKICGATKGEEIKNCRVAQRRINPEPNTKNTSV